MKKLISRFCYRLLDWSDPIMETRRWFHKSYPAVVIEDSKNEFMLQISIEEVTRNWVFELPKQEFPRELGEQFEFEVGIASYTTEQEKEKELSAKVSQ